ncbi:MAG: hypothetical protein ACI4PO_03620 [Faecousia sp.]
MKKLISYILLLAMCVALFAGCAANEPTEPSESEQPSTAPSTNTLENAEKYLFNMYKDDALVTRKDYSVITSLLIGEDEYTIAWSVDVDSIEIVADAASKSCTVKLPTDNTAEIDYVLTGTLSDGKGNTASVSFNHQVPAAKLTAAQIVDLAYSLGSGESMDGPFELTGSILSIDTAWSDQYSNITVTIQVGDLADKPIMCYRLAGDGADTLAVGDTITVSGNFKNYNGTVEFDAGCQLLSVVKSVNQTALLEASYALQPGASLPEKIALLGTIISIDTEWSEQYQNITVTIVCDGKTEYPIMCYRLKGDGAADLAVGQEIAVYGTMKNYQHSSGDTTIEFDSGCQLLTMAEFSELFNPVPPTSSSEEPDVDPVPPTNPGISSEFKDGDTVTIYNPGDGVYVTGTLYEYVSSSGKAKNELVVSSNASDAIVLTVKVSGDTVSFVTADGKYLYADGTNVQLVDAAGENTAFVLEAASGGYYIRCATATYNNNPQYLEIYKGYLTVYGLNTSNAGIYTFQLNKQ